MALQNFARLHRRAAPKTVLNNVLRPMRPGLVAVGVFSLFINVLGLVGPLYMMQIYDRVLGTRNLATLAVLTLIVAVLYAVFAALESLRSAILSRVGLRFDHEASGPVFDAVHRASLRQPSAGQTQALRDLDMVREGFSGSLLVLCDLPWVPIYILAVTALSPWYGLVAVISGLVSAALAYANHCWTRDLVEGASKANISANNQAVGTFRNAEALHAMAMLSSVRARWLSGRRSALISQSSAADRSAILLGFTRFNRLFTLSLVLGLGAFLVIQRQITPGVIIAASIIVGRSTQPIEAAISNWKNIVGVRAAFMRLQDMLRTTPSQATPLTLPMPTGAFSVENITVHAPGTNHAVLKGVNFSVPAGKVLGVVGPSAAGKSSLARVLVGTWEPSAGTVRLDGSELRHWDPEQLGQHLGYVPQDAALFPGTIAENISRFGTLDHEKIVAAARAAGIHELIQRLPAGYNTQIGEAGAMLSGGQRQRIALARALYGAPVLIILDEPNAHLDSAGEQSLVKAIQDMTAAGQTVVLITHTTRLISVCDYVLFLNEGAMQGFGSRDEVMSKLLAPRLVVADGPKPSPAPPPPAPASSGAQ